LLEVLLEVVAGSVAQSRWNRLPPQRVGKV